MIFQYVLGMALLCWVVYDLVTGKAYLHRAYLFEQEPLGYLATVTLWLLLALSCFIWPW